MALTDDLAEVRLLAQRIPVSSFESEWRMWGTRVTQLARRSLPGHERATVRDVAALLQGVAESQRLPGASGRARFASATHDARATIEALRLALEQRAGAEPGPALPRSDR